MRVDHKNPETLQIVVPGWRQSEPICHCLGFVRPGHDIQDQAQVSGSTRQRTENSKIEKRRKLGFGELSSAPWDEAATRLVPADATEMCWDSNRTSQIRAHL